MKFAVACLLATASAMRIETDKKELACVSHRQARRTYDELDTDHTGTLTPMEVKVGVEALAKELDHTITKEEWKWIQETGEKIDSKTPGQITHKEFWKFSNALFKHFDLCKYAQEERRWHNLQNYRKHKQGCVTWDLARDGFKKLDTNHNHSLSYDEIKIGLEELAKSQGHTITKGEWEWIKATGSKIDSKTPGKVNEFEFWQFSNAVFEHFGLCHLAKEAEDEMYGTDCDASRKETDELYEKIDTNNSGKVGGAELMRSLNAYAESIGHTITHKELRWIRSQFIADANGNTRGLGKAEFHDFYNAFANKY